MTLLKTKEYIDIVDLSNFLHDNYDWPALGSSDSFHRVLSEAMDFPGQDSAVHIELPNFDDPEDTAMFEQDYGESYIKVARVFEQLILDGHLPKRDEYEIYVWW